MILRIEAKISSIVGSLAFSAFDICRRSPRRQQGIEALRAAPVPVNLASL
jgi:hypothetical protein